MQKAQAMPKSRVDTRQLATMAMLVAMAFVVMVVTRIPLMASADFLKYDPKDVVLVIGAFLFGPGAGLCMTAAVCFIEMVTVGTSGFYGFVMNLVASAAFVCPAALLYHRKRTMTGAICGLVLGAGAMTASMLLWNYIVVPIYRGWPREKVAGMLLPVFLPFNAIKASLNAALTLVLYQPVTNALRRAHLLPALPDGSLRRRINVGVLALGLLLLLSCVLLVLSLRGII